jgi:hypothetical protein
VSKRHQSSRRKTYGRRQHEVRERKTRDIALPMDDELEDTVANGLSDRFAFLDPRSPSLRFAMGD